MKIYGVGPQEKYLQKIAGQKVEFLGPVTDKEKFELLSGAKAFIAMATDEDFGITPVEAMAVGTPVIAYKGGGYLETVVEGPPSSRYTSGLRTGKGKTGVFVEEATVEALASKLQSFKASEYQPEDCRKQAEKFSKERFKKEVIKFVKKNVES